MPLLSAYCYATEPSGWTPSRAYRWFAGRDPCGRGAARGQLARWLNGRDTLVYEQTDATPASFTILNFEVNDIDATVDALVARGVRFERYDDMAQDQRGVFRDEGPCIAWFKDPSGNLLSILQEK
jgi:catechol 2,3-dioxygenase-like lactoylglutathione lyase family enzyme